MTAAPRPPEAAVDRAAMDQETGRYWYFAGYRHGRRMTWGNTTVMGTEKGTPHPRYIEGLNDGIAEMRSKGPIS